MEDLSRRDALLKTQNPDGGWGYFPGKQSWLEPTAWTALALHGHEAAERAYRLVRGWQKEDGTTSPCATVDSPHWTSALVTTLAALRKDKPVVQRGLKYLMETAGSDSGPLMRIMHFLDPQANDRDPKFEGWPWRPGASAWIEPTVHGITALRLANPLVTDRRIKARIASAQNLIWHQRCRDGGWNYGARVAREVTLHSFPETTALALIGLIGRPKGVNDAIASAKAAGANANFPLAGAWLSLALRLHGLEAPEPARSIGRDIVISAITELSSEHGNWRLLGEGVA